MKFPVTKFPKIIVDFRFGTAAFEKRQAVARRDNIRLPGIVAELDRFAQVQPFNILAQHRNIVEIVKRCIGDEKPLLPSLYTSPPAASRDNASRKGLSPTP